MHLSPVHAPGENCGRTLAIIMLSGIAGLFFGQSNTLLHVPPLTLLYPVSLVLLGYMAKSNATAFRHGMLTALFAIAAGIYWVSVPMEEQAGLPWYMAMATPLLLGAALGIYAGCFSVLARVSLPLFSPVQRALFLGISWGAVEYIRGIAFTGFPWLVLPAAFAPWPIALQPLSLLGVYGYSAVLATVSLLLLETARHLPGAQRFSITCNNTAAKQPASRLGYCKTPLALTLLLVALCGVWSAYALQTPFTTPVSSPTSTSGTTDTTDTTDTNGNAESPHITLALVQGNIDQGLKWNPAYQRGTVERYVSMSKVARERAARKEENVDLIIWPETAMPFYIQENTPYRGAVRTLAITGETAYLIGSPAYASGTKGRDFDVFNRIYMLQPSGLFTSFYDKEHLVPFGEYLPFGLDIPVLRAFFEGSGTFVPGNETAPLRFGNLALGMLICYEAIFPELARKRVAQGANILVNVSNDAWFGKTSAPYQHLHLAMLRAVEQGRYLLRGTNTGISAIVDDKGRIATQGGLFRAEVVSGDAMLLTGTTPYFTLAPYLHALLFCIPAAMYILTRRKQQ